MYHHHLTGIEYHLSDLRHYNVWEVLNRVTFSTSSLGEPEFVTWTQIINWETSSSCDGVDFSALLLNQ